LNLCVGVSFERAHECDFFAILNCNGHVQIGSSAKNYVSEIK